MLSRFPPVGSLVLSLCASSALCSCATTRPTAMNVMQHEDRAAAEHAAANEDVEEYDPRARQVELVGQRYGMPPHDYPPVAPHIVNPTERHLLDAHHHEQIALAHQKAATELLAAEEDACRPFPEPVRAACPDVGVLASVKRVLGGVRATPQNPDKTPLLAARIRCHLAYNDAFGDEGAIGACPLSVRGLRVQQAGDALVFRGGKAGDRKQLTAFLDDHVAETAGAE